MAIFSVYVVNKAGGLIYQYDNYVPRTEVEKTFSYPLDLVLKHHDEKVIVSFGQRDGIKGNILNLAWTGADVSAVYLILYYELKNNFNLLLIRLHL